MCASTQSAVEVVSLVQEAVRALLAMRLPVSPTALAGESR